jgi:hypothetical protein
LNLRFLKQQVLNLLQFIRMDSIATVNLDRSPSENVNYLQRSRRRMTSSMQR